MTTDTEIFEQAQEPETKILPPKRNKRWPRVLLGLVIIVAFAAGGIYWRITPEETINVLALDRSLVRGEVIQESDLRIVELDPDQPIWYISEDSLATTVGKIAVNAMGAGTIITPSDISTTSPLGFNEVIIGMALDAGQYPIQPLLRGDLVDVIAFEAASTSSTATSVARVVTQNAEVVQVTEIGGQTRLLVSLRVNRIDTTTIAAAASQGRIWLVLVSA